MAFKVVDLFSGAGGMSFGFKSHPAFDVVFAVDAEAGKPSSGMGSLDCNASYEANIGIPVRGADLSSYTPAALLHDANLKAGDVSVLISCAPCTGFSRTTNENHLRDDPRNALVERTAEIRERALVIAVAGTEGELHTLTDLWSGHRVKTEATWVERAIGGLPEIKAGRSHPDLDNHVSPGFSDPTTEARMRAIPPDGGSWADLVGTKHEGLLTPAMKRYAAARDFGSHPDVYGRLWWKRPCVTIKRECAHVGNGRFSHPTQHRLCTVRELALLNGFPLVYRFVSSSLSNRYRHIGDAVPPLVSHQLAHVCHWILTGKRPNLRDCALPGTSLKPEDITEASPGERPLPLFAGVTS